MKKALRKLYWKWEESKLRDPMHWALFLSFGLIIVIHLVSSITASAIENDGFGIYNQSAQAIAGDI